MDANGFKAILNSTVSISELTKAGAKKIFDNLKADESKIVLKNNKPIAALISTDRYQELLNKEEDLQFIQLAMSRKAKNHKITNREEFLCELGISEEEIQYLPEIDLE